MSAEQKVLLTLIVLGNAVWGLVIWGIGSLPMPIAPLYLLASTVLILMAALDRATFRHTHERRWLVWATWGLIFGLTTVAAFGSQWAWIIVRSGWLTQFSEPERVLKLPFALGYCLFFTITAILGVSFDRKRATATRVLVELSPLLVYLFLLNAMLPMVRPEPKVTFGAAPTAHADFSEVVQ